MKPKTLFIDIGGVFLTNGWDRHSRKRAAEKFSLDYSEMEDRHVLIFDSYEAGKITLEGYLNWVVFYRPRSFSQEEFIQFIFAQSKPFPDMIRLIQDYKERYQLQVVALSNEGREIAQHRIQTFKLNEWIDFFVISSFVHIRKPDPEIYRMALDLSQTNPQEIVYIDDRPMLIEIGQSFGLQTIHHVNEHQTRDQLKRLFISTS